MSVDYIAGVAKQTADWINCLKVPLNPKDLESVIRTVVENTSEERGRCLCCNQDGGSFMTFHKDCEKKVLVQNPDDPCKAACCAPVSA